MVEIVQPASEMEEGVQSVTGLNTNNTDPLNPVIQISVDGTTITGQGTPVSPLIGSPSGVSIQDTQKNILAITPTKGLLAWATDLEQFMVADGSNWWIDSSYLSKDLQNPDMGGVQGSNRSGYGQSYVTNKDISNCTIGYGSNNALEGAIRQDPVNHIFQVYQNGSWQTIVANFQFLEQAVDNYALEHKPVGFTQYIQIFSGNSDLLGLNGIPIIQGYKVCMGAYPFISNLSCGTF